MMKHLGILTGLANPDPKKLIQQNWSESIPKSTSINVFTDYVYNIVDGYSLQIHENSTTKGVRYDIEMKISNDLIIRYLNLSELYIPSRYGVPNSFRIGKSDSIVGIEYCTRVRSSYPVRIGNFTFYKHDPSDFLLNDYLPKISLPTFVTAAARHFEIFGD